MRLLWKPVYDEYRHFNPRTLWKSATSINFLFIFAWFYFNPRTLWKSATLANTNAVVYLDISIHALYERVRPDSIHLVGTEIPFQSTHSMKECDFLQQFLFFRGFYFNPRTLWKSATWTIWLMIGTTLFQSTHSMKECDPYTCAIEFLANYISIHALYERVRLDTLYKNYQLVNFNPRTLWKSATEVHVSKLYWPSAFQSTHSMKECDILEHI